MVCCNSCQRAARAASSSSARTGRMIAEASASAEISVLIALLLFFPFQLFEGDGHVVTIIIVEKLPFVPLAESDRAHRGLDIAILGEECPDLAIERAKVALFIGGAGRPGDRGRPRAGHGAHRRYRLERLQQLEPARQA